VRIRGRKGPTKGKTKCTEHQNCDDGKNKTQNISCKDLTAHSRQKGEEGHKAGKREIGTLARGGDLLECGKRRSISPETPEKGIRRREWGAVYLSGRVTLKPGEQGTIRNRKPETKS